MCILGIRHIELRKVMFAPLESLATLSPLEVMQHYKQSIQDFSQDAQQRFSNGDDIRDCYINVVISPINY